MGTGFTGTDITIRYMVVMYDCIIMFIFKVYAYEAVNLNQLHTN